MLGDTSAIEEWVERDEPPAYTDLEVRAWIAGLAAMSWRHPSRVIERLSGPETEVRWVIVPGTSVTVWWRVTLATDVVDLIAVAEATPEELADDEEG